MTCGSHDSSEGAGPMATWGDSDIVANFVAHRRHMPYLTDIFEYALRWASAIEQPVQRIVDLGCGEGVFGGLMLERFPDAELVLVDCSEPMLERARETFGGDDRVRLVAADLQTKSLAEAVPEPADLIVSSFALHHLTRERQRAVYAEAFDGLTPGGLFMNAEHTEAGSEAVDKLYWSWFIEHVTTRRVAAGESVTQEQVRAEFDARRDVDILSPACTLCGWLPEIGFVDADIVFKSMHMTLFGGRKPAR